MSLVNTLMQNLRVHSDELYKNSVRMGEYGALELFDEQTRMAGGIINEELSRRAFESIGRTLQVPVLDPNTNITISNSRSCTVADAENTSQMVTISFANISTGFTMVPNLYHNNDIGYEQDWIAKMLTATDAMLNAMDVMAVTVLGTNETQVFAQDLGYTITGNAVQVPYERRVNIYGDVNAMMRANKFRGDTMHIVGNAGAEAIMRNLAIFSEQNAQNLDGERRDKRFHYTNNIANAASCSGAFYAVAPGMVGMLTRVSRPELAGTTTSIGHEWGVERLPGSNITVGYHYYESVGDMSAIAGAASADMVCDKKEHFGFSVDVAFVTAYNAALATYANPIIKADIATSTNPTIAFGVKTLA